MLRRYWYKVDWSLLIPVFLLLFIGVLMIISTSSIVGFSNYNNAYFFIKRHCVFLVAGLIALFTGMIFPHQWYKKLFSMLFAIGVLLLILTLTPLGVKIGGAQRWLDLGFLRFQPVELVKFTVVIFTSIALQRSSKYLSFFFKGCLPILAVIAIPLTLLLMQPDLGNTAIILAVVFSLFFLSRMPLRHIFSLVGLSFVALCIIISQHSYQMARITSFLNPWDDPLGKNYHMIQSLIAIGSGGFTGVGLGESKLKYFYLPLQYSDFIYSIICEEGGFILGALVICLYLWFLFKTLSILKRSNSEFSYFLGAGCALFISLQAFINICVVIGLLPVTGIPLTFISFGGTSLVSSLFYVGVILNISNSILLEEYDIKK